MQGVQTEISLTRTQPPRDRSWRTFLATMTLKTIENKIKFRPATRAQRGKFKFFSCPIKLHSL